VVACPRDGRVCVLRWGSAGVWVTHSSRPCQETVDHSEPEKPVASSCVAAALNQTRWNKEVTGDRRGWRACPWEPQRFWRWVWARAVACEGAILGRWRRHGALLL